MDTFFSPNDWRYAAIAMTAVLVDTYVLQRVMPYRSWLRIRKLSTFLHEFAHYLAAILLGGRARMSITPRELPSGAIAYGLTEWEGVRLGVIGSAIVAAAPLLWFVVAVVIADTVFSQPRDLLTGLGGLAACMVVCGAGLQFSASDIRAMGWFLGTWIVLVLASFMVGLFVNLPFAICAWFPVVCS